ncbi:MAG: 30S ribosomal protein S3 [Candidatus Omnitrophica bacterium]|nr:30S ribosomal protein S3 [Candidatus Omnitrophota bacterium]
MGQKAHPLSVRLGVIETWNSRWYARHEFAKQLHEDIRIREHIRKELGYAAISKIEIERTPNRIRIILKTARPGVIIGRKGQEIERLTADFAKMTGRDTPDIKIDVEEVKHPQIDAQLIAENVSFQLVRRVAFRRAMKKAIQTAMARGAQGIKIKVGGRLAGAEIARKETYHEGKVPLQTFRADVQYGFSEAQTTYGTIGVKVWVYKGEVLGPSREGREQEIKDRIKGATRERSEEGLPTKQTDAWSSDELFSGQKRPRRGRGTGPRDASRMRS